MTEDEKKIELIRSAHVDIQKALARYCEGLQGLDAHDGATILLGSSAAILAGLVGNEFAAAALRQLADRLAPAPSARDLN